MKSEFHVMSDLPCPLIAGTAFMKSFDICPKWERNGDQNTILIQRIHEMKIMTTKSFIAPIKSVECSMITLTKSLSFKVKINKTPKRIQTNVYADEAIVLNDDQKKNVSIKHKFIIQKFYFFESVRQRNDALGFYFSVVNFIVRDDTTSIPVANLGERNVNIFESQLLGRMKYFDNKKMNQNFLNIVNFNFENVFVEKYFGKDEFENVKNSFAIEFDFVFESIADSDISDH